MQISLVIPVYNLSAYVPRTLGSVHEAICRDVGDLSVEVICVDDGSSDGSGGLLDELCGRYGFRALHKTNGGEGSARNAALSVATGEYVMFLDGDDVLLPNAFQAASQMLRECPGADLYAFRLLTFADGADEPAPEPVKTWRVYDLECRIPAELISRLGVCPTLFRRTTAGSNPFGDLPLGADRQFVMEFLAKAQVAVVSDAVVLGYRLRGGSMSQLPWSASKVRSLCDHAIRGLAALAGSGRHVGRDGADYLASLVVSEVPARIARLSATQSVEELALHWLQSIMDMPVCLLSRRLRIVRRLTLAGAWSWRVSVALARLCRAMGMA